MFRLASAPVVVRIGASTALRHRVEKVVHVATWLTEHEVPAVRLLSGVPQPVQYDGYVATIWEAVPTFCMRHAAVTWANSYAASTTCRSPRRGCRRGDRSTTCRRGSARPPISTTR